jgi:iron complex outermembrane recepter protein
MTNLAPFSFPLALLPLALSSAFAQTSQLPPVTVTGAPIIEANRVDTFGALSTDVGEAQLRDLNALDLSAALRRTPGVVVSRFNPVGSFGGDEGGAVYVRGMGASRPGSEIKTYVDGIPFYMGVWNHSLLDLLPVHGMESIQVHKGPQPQRFGNTFAAIELTPRRTAREGLSGNLRLNAGSFSTVVEQADLAWRQGDSELGLAQGAAHSDGHRDDADGRLSNLMLSGSQRLNPHWRVGLLLLGADNKVSDPGEEGQPATKTGTFATRGSLTAVSLEHQHGPSQGRLQLYANQGRGDADNPSGDDTLSRFQLSGLRWREQLQPWQGAELVAGLDIDRMSGSVAFNGYTAFDGVSLHLNSPYAALAHTMMLGEGWSATPSAGVRLYRHSVFGNSSAPHAGLVLEKQDLALRLNAARGLNHPGLDAALLNAITPALADASPDGWRQLEPERMDHVEAGLRWTLKPGSSLDLALFHDQLKNRYVFAFPPAVAVASFTNLGDYTARGAEASWQQQWNSAWSSFAGLTLLDSSLVDLPYAPKRALALGLSWREGPWRVSADAQTQSAMFVLNKSRANASTNSARVGGFAVVNLRAAYALAALGPRGEVFVALDNLGDKRYAYRPGYPMPGRSGQIGLNYSL